MDTITFCLELSSDGEEHLQRKLLQYPHKSDVIGDIDPPEIYRNHGAVLRIWEKMDDSVDTTLLDFIYEVIETLALEHFRYVFISPHGDGKYDGSYEGPHHLRMVHYPEAEYEPDGRHVPEPDQSVVKNERPGVICEEICSLLLEEQVLADDDALREALQSMSVDVRLGFIENVADESGGIADLAFENPGNDLKIRVFIRVEPVAAETSEAGGSQS